MLHEEMTCLGSAVQVSMLLPNAYRLANTMDIETQVPVGLELPKAAECCVWQTVAEDHIELDGQKQFKSVAPSGALVTLTPRTYIESA